MTGGIVKKDNVKMADDPRNLGQAPAGMSSPQSAARILEQDEAGALIEITCACGERTYLRCDYAAGPSAD